MLRKILCQPGRKPKNIEESKREEEIPLTESNVELLISELDLFTTPLRLLNRTDKWGCSRSTAIAPRTCSQTYPRWYRIHE